MVPGFHNRRSVSIKCRLYASATLSFLCLSIPGSFSSFWWVLLALDSSGSHPRPTGVITSSSSVWTIHHTVIAATVKTTTPFTVPVPTHSRTSAWRMGALAWAPPSTPALGFGVQERRRPARLGSAVSSPAAPESSTPKMLLFFLSCLTFPIRCAKHKSEALVLISETRLNKPFLFRDW